MKPPANALPTIDDVALLAGVSTATVSRVVNLPDSVRVSSRDKVLEAIRVLGYWPNAGARSLKSRRSKTIGAVFPTVDNAIFAKAIDALQRRLGEAGYQLLIASSEYDPISEERQALNLLARGADGLVLCGCGQSPDWLARFRERHVPVVHVMTWPAPPDMLCVGFDNVQAMRQVVRHLVALGHRHIAMLSGRTQDNDRAAARVCGVREALEAEGLAPQPGWLAERRYGLTPAREGLRELLALRPAPTAIVCGNDVLAIGALLEAQHLGLSVPSQLSIVGFDDLELAAHISPALTTVRVPSDQMWRCAAEQLLAALDGSQPPPVATQLSVELVVRESSGPAPVRSSA